MEKIYENIPSNAIIHENDKLLRILDDGSEEAWRLNFTVDFEPGSALYENGILGYHTSRLLQMFASTGPRYMTTTLVKLAPSGCKLLPSFHFQNDWDWIQQTHVSPFLEDNQNN